MLVTKILRTQNTKHSPNSLYSDGAVWSPIKSDVTQKSSHSPAHPWREDCNSDEGFDPPFSPPPYQSLYLSMPLVDEVECGWAERYKFEWGGM